MRREFIFVIIVWFIGLASTGAYADPIPDAVMNPYKAFTTAFQSKDYKTAMKHVKTAWTEAEKQLGDSQTTGDLAFVYGKLALQLGDGSAAVQPLMRSADLAELTKKDGALIRLEREVELATALLSNNQKTKAWKRIDKARAVAGANGLDDSIFAAELRVHQARILATNANRVAKYSEDKLVGTRIFKKDKVSGAQSKSASYASDAIAIFEKQPEQTRWDYLATAYKLIGFSYERDKEYFTAAMAYQKAMDVQKQHLKFEDTAYIRTVGRWSNTRTHILSDMDLDEARDKGLCDCWPFHEQIDRVAKPVKRMAPNMPSKAFTSGFSFMKFDLDDEGKTKNVQILHSWPEKIYERSSKMAVKSWRYTARIDGETDAQRTGIVVPIKYILTDYYGSDPI